ncbi:proteasome chaperone 3/4 [Scheffersomyces xylosifermentans]|uniref:proteasome chaperone 3/4 n=1 Tax=Scheffersomyces xylosifermentans TaxID=1304137 RepID=UPI00315C67EF
MSEQIEQDPSGFSKAFTTYYKEDKETEIFFHKIELEDKIIFNVQFNGVMDTTFDIPISSRASINHSAAISHSEDDSGVEPVLLVGNHGNLKISIVATQIGKLIAASQSPKNTILSIGSKWFGKGDETNEDDFDKLMFILDNARKLL